MPDRYPMKVGLIVNPVAGMGGSVGLKGTDGADTLRRAIALGARPLAEERTARALSVLTASGQAPAWIALKGEMGGDVLKKAGLSPKLLDLGRSASARATEEAAHLMREAQTDLIVFSGGDGTARDIARIVGLDMPVLGIPAGVKMHSGVFAVTPEAAGRLLADLCRGDETQIGYRRAEVMDIDEAALRNGHLNARLYGYARVPHLRHLVQNAKVAPPLGDEAMLEALGHEIAAEMQPGTTYLIGPGTTAKRVLSAQGDEGALLGLDVVRDRRMIASDVTADEALKLAEGGPLAIIAGVTGGQGFVFGRGNQQISPAAIGRAWPDDVIILASAEKLARLPRPELIVDTGDPLLDEQLKGYARVRTGPRRSVMMRLV
jgi:predicted polyphosphate/ATP-dependent NAD kinase